MNYRTLGRTGIKVSPLSLDALTPGRKSEGGGARTPVNNRALAGQVGSDFLEDVFPDTASQGPAMRTATRRNAI